MQSRFTRMVVLVAGLGLATAACGQYSIGNIRSLKAFKDGNDLYGKGDYKGAVALYEKSISFNPDLGFAYFFLGNSYDKLYKPGRKGEAENDAYLPKAVENYRKALDKLKNGTDPQEVTFRKRSYEFLIAAYGSDKLDDFAQAEPVARELIASEPNEPANYQAIGKLYEEQGRFDEAEAMFVKATEVKPDDPVGFQVLASYYNRQAAFDKTMQAFQKRADLEPNNPEAWHTMGTYYFEKVSRDKTLTPAQARAYVTSGLTAEDKALALNGEYFEALTFKNLLLRLQANIERDPATQKRLLAEADSLRERAINVQAKQQAGAAAAAATAGKK
jgi:tetratricopeptide (TPR) repeat protein